ncbi:MAG TPA: glycosyltransferase family 39 protein [Candidatus Woesebacteria bacterium]|nr:glycosyltransferase family 39 protein [Candidatus Woesebacteria bacterium]
MHKNIFHLGILLLIIFLAAFLRFFHLGSVPTSLTIDEIGNGYNAYSLSKTGRDEWGIKLPPYFRSTGDYDAPVLIYLMVPPVWLFGLNEFATRVPSALLSLLVTPFVYLLCRKYLLKNKSVWFSLAAAFFYATSQWSIFFGRSGFEAVIALGFVIPNIYLLFRGIEKKSPWYFYLGLILACISTISYSSNKIFTPLINLLFIIIYRKDLWAIFQQEIKNKKWRLGVFLVLFSALLIYLAKTYLFGPGAVRAGMVFFTNDFDYRRGILENLPSQYQSLLGLPMLVFFWIKRFLEYFSLNFYTISGLGLTLPGHPGAGVINMALFPLFVIGFLATLIKDKDQNTKKAKYFILGWFLIGLLPATLANNSQHALRTLNSSVAAMIMSALGLSVVIEFLAKKSKKLIIIFFSTFFLFFVFDLVRFSDYYVVHYSYELSEGRGYGWKEMAIFADKVHSQYDNVYVDPRFGSEGRTNYGVPYSYFQFHSQYDPQTFHDYPGRDKFISDFENYHFLELDFNQSEEIKGNNLYIASPWSFPDNLKNAKHIVYEVKYPNGKTAFYAITNKEINETNNQK